MEIEKDFFRITKPTKELFKLFFKYQDEIDNEQVLNTISDDISNEELIKLLTEAIKTGKKIKL